MPPENNIPGTAGGVGVGVGSSAQPNVLPQNDADADNSWPEAFDQYGNVETKNKDSDISKTDATLFSDDSKKSSDRQSLINKAKNNYQKGKQLAKNVRELDNPENRERVKKIAEQKARKVAKDQLSKRITNEGVKKGINKGLKDSAGKMAKEGAKKAAKKVTEQAAKQGAKAGAKVAAKGAGEAASVGLNAAVDVAAGATGFETFGIGFLVGFLLNIAISLGVADTVDAAFELSHGNLRRALFLVHRAAAKIGTFFFLLIAMAFTFSVAGWIIGIPMLIILNLYMIAGKAFKNIGLLQGVTWWMMAIILFIDFFAFLFLIVFIFSLGWYLCSTSGLGSGGVTGVVANAVVAVYDWWNKSSLGSTAAAFCQFVTTTAAGGTP